MPSVSYKYNKHQKLKSRKLVENLFSKGKSTLAFPVKLVYTLEESDMPKVLSGAGVSKKYFKKAHDRNYIKRLIREAYRHHQHQLIAFSEKQKLTIHFFMLYIYKELPNYESLNVQMPTIIQKLIKQITNEKEIK